MRRIGYALLESTWLVVPLFIVPARFVSTSDRTCSIATRLILDRTNAGVLANAVAKGTFVASSSIESLVVRLPGILVWVMCSGRLEKGTDSW